KWT
ncbi:helix-turn-helix domain protein, partial [Escherichia coli 96.0428]